MYVVKRDGRKEPVQFDKITARIEKLCYGLDENFIEPILIAQKVVKEVYNGVTTSELDASFEEDFANATEADARVGALLQENARLKREARIAAEERDSAVDSLERVTQKYNDLKRMRNIKINDSGQEADDDRRSD